jgi:hypothetical protein
LLTKFNRGNSYNDAKFKKEKETKIYGTPLAFYIGRNSHRHLLKRRLIGSIAHMGATESTQVLVLLGGRIVVPTEILWQVK